MSEFTIRPLERDDREWVAHFLDKHWGTTQIVTRGKALYGHLLPGFVAEKPDDDGDVQPVGLLTYNIEDNQCEIMTLDSMQEGVGIGTALVGALRTAMKEAGIKRVWLITTNDNLSALKFWQKRDFHLVTIHRDAIAQARRLKPQIPILGLNGIPIRDEIELEMLL